MTVCNELTNLSKRQVRRPEGVHQANDGTAPAMVDSSASIAPVPMTVPVEILVPMATLLLMASSILVVIDLISSGWFIVDFAEFNMSRELFRGTFKAPLKIASEIIYNFLSNSLPGSKMFELLIIFSNLN